MENSIKKKEALFCSYYLACRNPSEAAAKAGFRNPVKSGMRLMESKKIREYIKKGDKEKTLSDLDIIGGYRRLAFGCVNDPISLIYSDEITPEMLSSMDLFNIAEIKRPKGGGIEIKFFDRTKALDKLAEYRALNSDSNPIVSLYNAISDAAKEQDK